ncbi:hypothetical protein [Salipiger marinus]|uniref:hypothetical protein n=1 Tax=Salipiger marinus TaxID=555512 RepID=UPI00405A2DA4
MPKFQIREATNRSVAIHIHFEEYEKSIFTSAQWCAREETWTVRWQSRETIAGWLRNAGLEKEGLGEYDIECLRNSLVSPHLLTEGGDEVLDEIERITDVPSHQMEWLLNDLSRWAAETEEGLAENALKCPPEEAQQLVKSLLRNALEITVAMIDGEVNLEFEGTPVDPVTQLRLN